MHDEPSHPIELIAFIVVIIAFLPVCIIWWGAESFVNLFRTKKLAPIQPKRRRHDGTL